MARSRPSGGKSLSMVRESLSPSKHLSESQKQKQHPAQTGRSNGVALEIEDADPELSSAGEVVAQGSARSSKKGRNGKRRGSDMATTVARKTRHESPESDDEGQNDTTFNETPEERSRAPSVELGEPSSARAPADTITTTSASSIFDSPESSSPTPALAGNQNRKRKRHTEVASVAAGSSSKRTKTTGSSTSHDENFTPRTPVVRSPAKKTYSSSKRSRLTGQESSDLAKHHQNQPPNEEEEGSSSEDSDDDVRENGTNENLNECDICGRIFKSVRRLQTHRAAHSRRDSGVGGLTGHFTAKEMDMLDQYRERACNEYGISVHEFNELINWPKGPKWPNPNVQRIFS